jgi:hypothetical protein
VPVPTSYTEAELKAFMHATIGTAAEALGWETDNGGYDEAVNDTLLTLGVEDVADTDASVTAVRALARYFVWSHVVDASSGLIQHSVDQQSFRLSDVQKQAAIALARAEAAVLALAEVIAGTITIATTTAAPIRISTLRHRDNPYRYPGYVTDALRVLP